MDKKQAEELIQVIRDLVEVLKPKPLPTFEEAVEAKVKNIVLELGSKEVFDRIGSGQRAAVDSLINREKARVAVKAQDIIEKSFIDSDYKTEKDKEIDSAVSQALTKQREQLEKEKNG